jgi:hypothetical protein
MLIEFSGTPGSGKNSVINSICRQPGIDCEIIQADEEVFDLQNSNFELKNLWTIFDTYSRFERIQKGNIENPNKLVIVNRGLFDRVAWSRLLKVKNPAFTETADYLEKWLINKLIIVSENFNYKIYLLLTSYNKIISRRPHYLAQGEEKPWIVNRETIENLNLLYRQLHDEFCNVLNITIIDDLEDDLALQAKVSVTLLNLLKA